MLKKSTYIMLLTAIAGLMISPLAGCIGDSSKANFGTTTWCASRTYQNWQTSRNWGKWLNALLGFVLSGWVFAGDFVIFNTIQFWTGDNPMAQTTVTDADGVQYLMAKNDSTITVTNQATGEVVTFNFDAASSTFSAVDAQGASHTIATMTGENSAVVYSQDGAAQEVSF